MSGDTKTHLIEQLKEAHQALHATIGGLDAALVVHIDSGWRVHDILGHLGTWYGERVLTLRAWQQGQERCIPDYTSGDVFNLRAAEQRKDWPYADILADWEGRHAELIALLEEVPADQFETEILLPWGQRGTIQRFIELLIVHEHDHRQEILAAL